MTTITIDPVTRIEGHARVFLDLAEDGTVADAGLVVNELRGFERILVGMEADRMPLITARICGVCPTAHHLAAARALDHAAGVEPPPAALLLRELMYMGHVVHSHALSLFVLQGPDLFLGLDSDPATRNIVGLVAAAPEVAKKALRIRSLGQHVNELVGGRGIHPVTAVAGGIAFELDGERRGRLEAWAREAVTLIAELLPLVRGQLLRLLELRPDLATGWSIPTWSLGTVTDGALDFLGDTLRVCDEAGAPRLEFRAADYHQHLVEAALDWSYMKPVYLRDGAGERTYRVGTLARLNVADRTGTPLADAELETFRAAFPRPCHGTLLNAWARAIELLHAAERAVEILRDPRIGGETRVPVRFRGGRGVAHVEAARGTLFHDYEIDDQGIVRAANLIVATQQNYAAINQSIRQAAGAAPIRGDDAGLLNAVEFAIRCYDPCLSCATHALGRMPLTVEVRRGGVTLRELRRRP